MSRPSLDQIRAVGDFSTKFRWNLIFATFPVLGVGVPASEDLNIRCESVTLPKLTGASIEINVRGHKVRQPGIHTYSPTIALTFLDTVDNVVHLFLKAWREACWTSRLGTTLNKSDLEALILLQRLNNQDEPIWQYKLSGVYLEDYEEGDLDGASSEAIKPQLTLSYDFFEDTPL